MKRVWVAAAIVCASLSWAESALAVPPTILSAGHQNRHPVLTLSAPRADDVYVSIAKKPDRSTSGEFLTENRVGGDSLTDSEIQAGRWLDESQLDPGVYYILIEASPDFDACYQSGGSFDPTCADGYSELAKLTVPRPTIRYTTKFTRETYLDRVTLSLVASRLGDTLPYRMCWLNKARQRRCLTGRLVGYSWNSSADDDLSVSTRGLATITTFTWFVKGQKVATKRVRVR